MSTAVTQPPQSVGVPGAGEQPGGPQAELRLPQGDEPFDAPEPQAYQLTGTWRLLAAVGVVVVVALSVVLRFWTRSALWLDEALTVNIARQPLHDLPGLLKRDGAPPLYYLLLHWWMEVFGDSDGAVRALSGVFSVVTLPLAWLAARRLGGRTAAWAALVLLATSNFAVYYATESRMYALVMLLSVCGLLALQQALRRPTPWSLLAIVVVTGALLYSQYWSLYLIGSVALLLIWRGFLGRDKDRPAARWSLLALVIGCVTFVPWAPTFVFQSQHTGTPWAPPPNFGAVVNVITGFTFNQASLNGVATSQGRLLTLIYFVLGGLAIFGVARGRWHVELDLRTRPRTRGLAFVIAATLFVAIGGGLISNSAFSPRYASVIYVLLVVLMAYGCLCFRSPKLRALVLAVAAAAGLAVAVPNIWTQRTQATSVAAVLSPVADHAKPGDIVAFCPDQLGPATYRLLPDGRYRELAFPRRNSPEYVDWVNYLHAAQSTKAVPFAEHLEQLAGTDHRIWYVWAAGYLGFGTKCQTIDAALTDTAGESSHAWVNQSPSKYYEPMSLVEFHRSS